MAQRNECNESGLFSLSVLPLFVSLRKEKNKITHTTQEAGP